METYFVVAVWFPENNNNAAGSSIIHYLRPIWSYVWQVLFNNRRESSPYKVKSVITNKHMVTSQV